LAIILAVSVIFGAIAIYFVEADETGKTINDIEDALWFSVTTITISGFGDVYPISTGGRLIASDLSFVGLAIILGFISSVGASVIVSGLSKPRNKFHQEELDFIKNRMDNLDKLNEEELKELTSDIMNLHHTMKSAVLTACQ
jgi:voltage-gated potassium channel